MSDSKCRDGMIAYIELYKDGELRQLAAEINDNGAYIDEVKKKAEQYKVGFCETRS